MWFNELPLFMDEAIAAVQACEIFVSIGTSGNVYPAAGFVADADLADHYRAADVFVLATRNEGWANVFLEAMACGLPVVTTDVGGNAEVVCRPELGRVVPFGDAPALQAGIDAALATPWDRAAIRRHALDNAWDQRVDRLVALFQELSTAPLPAAALRRLGLGANASEDAD